MREESDVRALLERVLTVVTAPHAAVAYGYQNRLATRFGENAITQNMGIEEENIAITVAYGNKHGSALANRFDDQSLVRLVNRAEHIARSSPEDPEYVPPIKPQPFPVIPQRYFDNVSKLTADTMAQDVKTVVGISNSRGFLASGIFEAICSSTALANSEGLFAFDHESSVRFSTTIHGPKGSGSASDTCHSYERLDIEGLGREALDTAERAQNPKPIEPGDYTVILEPRAVADLLVFLAWNLDARDAAEGTTVFAGTSGRKLVSSQVTLSTEIDNPRLPAALFGEDGLPARRTVWIKDGRIERLRHDRFWAKEKGETPDPLLFPLFLAGGDNENSDLVKNCSRGLLVKRFWYIRYVDRKGLLLTGMTRDGLFLVENGSIVGPVQNLRFNESPVVLLENITMLGTPVSVGGWASVPAVMSHDFTFDSTTASL